MAGSPGRSDISRDLKAEQKLARQRTREVAFQAKGTRYVKVLDSREHRDLGGPERRAVCQQNPEGEHTGTSRASHLTWPNEGCGFILSAPGTVFISHP